MQVVKKLPTPALAALGCFLIALAGFLLFTFPELRQGPGGTGLLPYSYAVNVLFRLLACAALGILLACLQKQPKQLGIHAKWVLWVTFGLLFLTYLDSHWLWNLSDLALCLGRGPTFDSRGVYDASVVQQFLVLDILDLPALLAFWLCSFTFTVANFLRRRNRLVPLS